MILEDPVPVEGVPGMHFQEVVRSGVGKMHIVKFDENVVITAPDEVMINCIIDCLIYLEKDCFFQIGAAYGKTIC